MASLREFRKKIKTIKSTQQITKAMKMVAAARLRKAQAQILAARPFALKMQEMVYGLSAQIAQIEEQAAALGKTSPTATQVHPFFKKNTSPKTALVLVTADKGLCGSFNTNLIRKAAETIRQHQGQPMMYFAVGRKGRDFLKRLGLDLQNEYVNVFNQLNFTHAEMIGNDLIEQFMKGEVSQVVIIYNEFKSVIQQKLTLEQLLPIQQTAETSAVGATHAARTKDFIYEPSRQELLGALLPRYIKAHIYRILMESYAAELGARMSSMDSATKNAKELIDQLTLKLNRTRQAMITREIAELVGGAEALK